MRVYLLDMRRAWLIPSLFVAACGSRDPSATYTYGERARVELVQPDVALPVITPVTTAPPVLARVELLRPVLRGPRQIDAFTQDEALVDVLWVVDNSASLSNERESIARELERFLGVLLDANVDFHVGVTSTDLVSARADRGRLRGSPPWIDRTTPDPVGVFRAMIDFPLDLDVRLEEGLAAMEAALSPPLANAENRGFHRVDAGLAVIIVSDEDDGSLGSPAHYVRFLQSLKGAGREVNVSLSAVVGDQPDGCVRPGEERIFGARAEAGDRYIDVALATGGLVESVCSADFGPFVESLALSLSGLRRFFPLSAPPSIDSIVVTVDGRRIPRSLTNGWTWDARGRGVTFAGTYLPPPGAEIRIEYDVAI